MPTEISDTEAKRAAARAGLARARQWRDDRRDAKSPAAKTAQTKSGASKTTPKRTPAAKRTSKAQKTATEEPHVEQYRKTPSMEERAKRRAEARANARDWSSQRKKKKKKDLDDGVPEVVDTSGENNVDDFSASDDFKTAKATEAQTHVINEYDVKELNHLKLDVKNAYKRIETMCEKYQSTIDPMNCE